MVRWSEEHCHRSVWLRVRLDIVIQIEVLTDAEAVEREVHIERITACTDELTVCAGYKVVRK